MYTEKGINSVSLVLAISLNVAILIIPSCVKEIEPGPYAGNYSIPVQLSGKSDKPQATQPAPKTELVKDAESKRGKTKKDNDLKDKADTKRQPGDRDAPAAYGQAKPIPPKIAINNEWSGTIILEVEVDYTGKMLSYKIIQSTGHKELDETFIKTVQSGYTFKPKRIMGKDQTGIVTLSYTFDL